MDNSKIIFLINDDVRAIQGKYEEHGKVETFKTLDPTISVGDLAVVESTTRYDVTTVKIVAVDIDVNFDDGTPLKWALQRIDKEGFDQTIALEAEAITAVQAAERRRKKAELRATLFKDHEASINSLKLANHSDDPITE